MTMYVTSLRRKAQYTFGTGIDVFFAMNCMVAASETSWKYPYFTHKELESTKTPPYHGRHFLHSLMATSVRIRRKSVPSMDSERPGSTSHFSPSVVPVMVT